MDTQGVIGIKATLDISELQRNVQKYVQNIDMMQNHTDVASQSVAKAFSRIQAAGAAYLSVDMAKRFVTEMVSVYGTFQQLDISFRTMLQSGDKATKLMGELVNFAAITPFNLVDVGKGAKQLIAYGTKVENIKTDLEMLGNVASGVSVPLGDLIYLYGTLRSQGRAYTVDIRQFAGRGVPIYEELAKVLKVNVNEVNELVEAGKVGFPQVEKAFQNMTNQGGMFFNLMQEQSKSVIGKISNLQDMISVKFNELGQANDGFINGAIDGASYMVEHYKEIGTALAALIATYGTYKTIIMSIAAYKNTAANIKYTAEIAELQKILPLKQQSANQDVIAAVASGKLTQSKAEQVIALRAEVEAKIKSLQATKAQAQADFSSALSSYKASRIRFTAAQEQMALAQSQMAIAVKSGTAEEIATAKKNTQTASTELNSASIAKNNAHKTVSMAATNRKSASEALSTAQTGYNTISQNVNTTSTNFLTVAKMRLAAASKALGLSMLADPYVWVAAAVVALGYGIYKLITAQTIAEQAQERYNKKVQEANEKEQERKEKLEALVNELQNEYTADLRRLEIIGLIKKEYPSFFKFLLDEQGHVRDLTEAWKAYNETVAQDKVNSNKENVENLKKEIFERKRFFELSNMAYKDRQNVMDSSTSDKTIWNKYIGKFARNIEKEIEKNERELWEWEKKVREDSFNQWQLDLKDKTDKQIEAIRESLVKRAKAANGDKNLLAALGKRISAIDEEKTTRDPKVETQNKSYWEKKKKEAQEELEALTDIEAAGEKGLKLKQKIAGYDNKINTFSTNTSKQEKANRLKVEQAELQRQIDEFNQQEKEKAAKAELELSQAVIDAKDEGYLKQQAQIEQNYKKAKAENIRRANEYVKDAQQAERLAWEKEHPNYKEKGEVFLPKTKTKNDLSPDKKNTLESYDKAASDEKITSEKNLAKSLLETYQYYTDERLAIEKKFNDDIEALRIQREKYAKEGNTEKVQQTDRAIAQGTKKKGESLISFDYEQLKKSPDYVRAFENLKQTSSETLNSLLSQLENAKQTAAQVLSPDQLREYTSTIQSIMDELDSRNPFQSLSDKKKELAEAEQELADAQIALENARERAEAVKGGAKIENGISSSKFNPQTGKIEFTKAYLSEAEALKKVEEKTKDYNTAKDKVVEKNSKVKKSEKEVRAEIDELFRSIDELGKSIGGLAGEIISMIGEIGTFTMTAMSGVKAAADTSATAISTVEKASVILMVISAAVQLATKMFDLFGADTTTEKYEKTKEAYESYINILDRVIDKQLELAESLSGENAQAAYDKAIELTKLQSENAKVLGKQYLNSGSSWKSHSKGYNEVDEMSMEGWKQAADALGMSVDQFKSIMGDRMTGLFDLTDEQLASLQENAGIFWSQLDSDTQKYADQIVEGVSQLGEVLEQQITDVTGISFDSLVDNFKSALSDMNSSAEDFAEDFEQYMMNAIINSFINGDEFKKKLEDWHKKFAEYSKSNNEIDANEKEELKKEWEAIVQEGVDYRNGIMETMGFDSSESTSQSSTQKGFTAMSQDSADELNGRFTALQMSGEVIKAQSLIQTSLQTNISVNIESIKSSAQLTGSIMSEMRDLSLIANGYLEQISKNTKVLSSMNDRLENIEKNTKGLI